MDETLESCSETCVVMACAGVAVTNGPTNATADTLAISRHFWLTERPVFRRSFMAAAPYPLTRRNFHYFGDPDESSLNLSP
jgi:hypothetical protein